MIIRLIGAGAVGLSVAAKLKSVSDFALIVDKERYDRYSAGLIYNGKSANYALLTPDVDSIKADLIILAVKNLQLYEALDEIAPFVKSDTIFLSLLNGIDAEEVLSSRFGSDKVLYSFITDLSSCHDGLETTCFHEGTIIFGEKDNSKSERVLALAALFDKAGQHYEIPEDIIHSKWWKFMLNTCFNTLSAILFADYYSIHDNDAFIRAVRLIAREVQSVAVSSGVILTQDDVEEMIRRVSALKDHGQTSMLQDVLAHRETENNYFAGAVSRLGKQNGVKTPLCDFAHILLEAKRHVYNA